MDEVSHFEMCSTRLSPVPHWDILVRCNFEYARRHPDEPPVPLDAFAPDKPAHTPINVLRTAAAQVACSKCPVADACLAQALNHRINQGILGGTGESNRDKMVRWITAQEKMRRKANPSLVKHHLQVTPLGAACLREQFPALQITATRVAKSLNKYREEDPEAATIYARVLALRPEYARLPEISAMLQKPEQTAV